MPIAYPRFPFSVHNPKQHLLHLKERGGADGVVDFFVFCSPKTTFLYLKPSGGDDGVVEIISFQALFIGVIEFSHQFDVFEL